MASDTNHPGLDIENPDDLLDVDEASESEVAKYGPLMIPIPAKGDREKERQVAAYVVKMWESQDPQMSRPMSQWEVNSARRQGVVDAKVVRDPDEGWIARMPRHASPDVTPDVNKAATLCRRMTSNMFVDPHMPVVSSTTRDLIGHMESVRTGEPKIVRLKGISDVHEVVPVEWL